MGAIVLFVWHCMDDLEVGEGYSMSWSGFMVDKKQKKVWQAGPSCFFWTTWKVRNEIAFRDEVLSIQKLKTYFVFLLWLETKLSIVDGPSPIVTFIDI